ncbi:MAG TPA: hypothetical protein VJZ68_06760 [Nitrososphaera sp.]|nr:hypothetical protein [Nitrososphaera sp.]
METAKFYTRDQNLRFLVDDALFSDSSSARIRAVNQIVRDSGFRAIAVIEEIVKTVPATDEEFRAFCINVIGKIEEQEARTEANEREWK